jgi:hemerythrin
MLIWNEQFATGSRTIDEQHRELIRHCNEFESLLTRTNPTRQDIAVIIGFLEFLEGYVERHFRYEEQCMDSVRCPAHHKNREAHAHFKQMFSQHKQHAEKEGFRLELLVELNRVIHAWIQDHILRVDTELKPCLARPGA